MRDTSTAQIDECQCNENGWSGVECTDSSAPVIVKSVSRRTSMVCVCVTHRQRGLTSASATRIARVAWPPTTSHLRLSRRHRAAGMAQLASASLVVASPTLAAPWRATRRVPQETADPRPLRCARFVPHPPTLLRAHIVGRNGLRCLRAERKRGEHSERGKREDDCSRDSSPLFPFRFGTHSQR